MKRIFLGLALAALASPALAQQTGYVTEQAGSHVMSPFGLCWHSGFWTDTNAVSPCDRTAQAEAPAPAPQPVAVAPQSEPAPAPAPQPVAVAPQPAPTPAPAPVAAQPAYEKVTLSADVLFDFNKATLKPAGMQKLDELADRLQGAALDEIRIVGHADRIGSPQYNRRLSEERAKSVKSYLESRTSARTILTAGRGSEQPVTGVSCRGMGPEQGANRRLVQCLQADRRVDIELFGVRTAGSGVQDTGSTPTRPASFSGSTR